MNRKIERRLSALEKIKPDGLPFTPEGLLEAVRSMRASGDMPEEWADIFTPSQLLRMADLQVGR